MCRNSCGRRPGPTQPETISTEMQRHFGTIPAGNTGHGFIKHLPRLRDHTARNTAGDLAPIRRAHTAGDHDRIERRAKPYKAI